MFFKSIILKEDYLAFLYFSEINKGNSLNILIAQYKNLTNDLSRNLLLSYNIEGINYVTNVSMSDFFRLDEKRAGFISTEGNPDNINRKLHIILFHFSPDYKKMKARRYSYYLTNYIFVNELSGTFYNGHLVLSATAILKKNIMQDADWTNYFSLLIIFGTPNGKNNTRDISAFLSGNDNYDTNVNFVTFLYDDLIIDNNNNIFGYIHDDKIKLVSIPDEITITKLNDETPIEINSYLYESENYVIHQNTDIIKTSQYYYLDFQYIIREPDFEDLFSNAHEVISNYGNNNAGDSVLKSEYEPKRFFGKIYRLKFKLCHNYCGTCNEFGFSDNKQNCLSCLPNYL